MKKQTPSRSQDKRKESSYNSGVRLRCAFPPPVITSSKSILELWSNDPFNDPPSDAIIQSVNTGCWSMCDCISPCRERSYENEAKKPFNRAH
ncbi:hypothetical protein CDAR_233301 [Caerostris darwini]|uniref:Uncharacterized protein n=1 Tax=Caerostris darwini TaxID=1538125 RepID=A0AAV4V4R3_9ARAC|nr:hypothetical protein CDAR_233301 [Caerostris darwini]